MKKIAVFCGSKKGIDKTYIDATADFIQQITKRGFGIVYGGGAVGLMGTVAETALKSNAEIIGVIPEKLYDMEVAHKGLSQLHKVTNMHERKAKMAALADAFVALPGGVGTLEEITEAMTWMTLGYHSKPCAFLNTSGFYNHFISFFEHMEKEGFLYQSLQEHAFVEDDTNMLAKKLSKAME